MRGYQQAHQIHEPEDKMMWGCEVTSKHTRTWGYEDAGCKWEQMNLRISGCKDVRTQAITLEHKDIRMRGYKGYKDIRIWGCEDINKSNISNI